MILLTKEQYASPRCEALEVRLEGVIALSPKQSGDPVFPESGFGTEQTW